ncbi:YtxH domain-containing protein [Portibacter marinus]|uniref:YtxH domain-containing protein n=1 Tax=Portibacter marinus TaxID=2898660 RepID=UPI001F1D3D2A|nr:YtxH domain-containing protein [Portibacter marinus]
MSDDRNNNTNKFLFIAGVITGAAATIYFNTPHGRKVRNAIVEKADEVKTNVSERANEFANTAKETGQSVLQGANRTIESVKDSARSALDSANSTIDSVKSRFINTVDDTADHIEDVAETKASQVKSGVKKAKTKLNSTT